MKSISPRHKSCKFIDSTNEILKSYKKEPRRSRIKLTDAQLAELEARFLESHHPSQYVKEDLVKKLEIPIKNIQIWFQNRRAKEKTERQDMQIKYEKRRQMKIDFENYLAKKDQYYSYMAGKAPCDSYQAHDRNRLREHDEYLLRSRK